MKILIAVALCFSLSGCLIVAGPMNVSAAATMGPSSTMEVRSTNSFTTRLNAFRAENGIAAVRQSTALTRAAQAHAEDMTRRSYFSHRSPGGPNGTGLIDRARSAGCNVQSVSENIASGQQDEAAVLTAWKNSPGHRRNMLGRGMTEYGLGRSGNVWVLMFSNGC